MSKAILDLGCSDDDISEIVIFPGRRAKTDDLGIAEFN